MQKKVKRWRGLAFGGVLGITFGIGTKRSEYEHCTCIHSMLAFDIEHFLCTRYVTALLTLVNQQ